MENKVSLQNWQKKKIQKSKQHQLKAHEEVNEIIFKSRIGREITLLDDTKLTEFVSCSYLGLDMDKRVIEASYQNIQSCGIAFHAARTRILPKSLLILEKLLNKIFCGSFSVIFPTLHLVHLGLIPLLASGEMPSYPLKNKGVTFILDKNVHASIQINRGLMAQFGEVVLIDFSDFDGLVSLLKKTNKEDITPILMMDSIGSMGGILPIDKLVPLIEKYSGYIYIDDAHGTSVFGKNGCGYVLEQLDYYHPPCLILASTLGKGFGVIGGCIVLPTQKDVDMVKRFSPTYIFGGPPALPVVDAAIASAKIHLSPELKSLQEKLQKNIQYFDSLTFSDYVLNYGSRSPIRGIKVGDEMQAISFTRKLREKGFAVTVAMYPTVPKNKSLLRIAIGATHKPEQIKKLCEAIKYLF